MRIAPFLLFVVVALVFASNFIGNKLLLLPIAASLLAMPLLYSLVRRRGIPMPKLPGFAKIGSLTPIFSFADKKYSASAILLTSAQPENKLDRLDCELNYERLSRFSEALGTIGIPAAYVSFSNPDVSLTGEHPSKYTNRCFVIAWASGRDEKELFNKAEMHLRQLEGICSVALPNVQTKRMSEGDLSLILSFPLPIALPKLVPFIERLNLSTKVPNAVPLPPPPNAPDPSAFFGSPEGAEAAGDGPFLGWIYSSGKKRAPLCLNLGDIQRHVSIFGATGGGKSTTAISLALRLSSSGVPLIILDWHGEHTKVVTMAGGKVFSPGSPDFGITINPLSISFGRDVGFQVELVTDIFSQIFQFTPPQSYMFREAIKACYNSKVSPTISDLIKELELLPIRSSWDHETRMALMRRLKLFTEGTCGAAVNGEDSLPREELFRGLVDIDLSYLKDVNSRSILSNLLLKIIYDYAVARGEQGSLSHVLIIEEAQNILPPKRPEMPRSIGERIIGEIRKYGEGIVVISQFPSAISQEVLKNTAIRIIHAVRSGDDLKVLGDSTSLSEEQRCSLSTLAQGEAAVNLPVRSSNFFVKVIPDPLLEMAGLRESDPLVCPHPQV
jgi:hypothetical protein